MIRVGDMVVYKKYQDVTRRVFDIKNGKALIWGFYEYVDIGDLIKVKEKQ